jgi:hypothetical protein
LIIQHNCTSAWCICALAGLIAYLFYDAGCKKSPLRIWWRYQKQKEGFKVRKGKEGNEMELTKEQLHKIVDQSPEIASAIERIIDDYNREKEKLVTSQK